jgi:hypothetical protein
MATSMPKAISGNHLYPSMEGMEVWKDQGINDRFVHTVVHTSILRRGKVAIDADTQRMMLNWALLAKRRD